MFRRLSHPHIHPQAWEPAWVMPRGTQEPATGSQPGRETLPPAGTPAGAAGQWARSKRIHGVPRSSRGRFLLRHLFNHILCCYYCSYKNHRRYHYCRRGAAALAFSAAASKAARHQDGGLYVDIWLGVRGRRGAGDRDGGLQRQYISEDRPPPYAALKGCRGC